MSNKPATATAFPTATLTVEVAFDRSQDLPDDGELESVINACRVYGRVAKAEYTIHRKVTRDLL